MPEPDTLKRPNRRYATIAAAAKYTALSGRTINNYIAAGRLTAYRIGTRVVRVDLNELDTLFSEGANRG